MKLDHCLLVSSLSFLCVCCCISSSFSCVCVCAYVCFHLWSSLCGHAQETDRCRGANYLMSQFICTHLAKSEETSACCGLYCQWGHSRVCESLIFNNYLFKFIHFFAVPVCCMKSHMMLTTGS